MKAWLIGLFVGISLGITVPAYADRVGIACQPIIIKSPDCSFGAALRNGRTPVECKIS